MSRYNYCDTTDRIYFKKDAQTAKELIIVEDACDRLNDLERQLEEAREFKEELVRKLTINKIGALSDKEVVLGLREYFKEQLKEKDDE